MPYKISEIFVAQGQKKSEYIAPGFFRAQDLCAQDQVQI